MYSKKHECLGLKGMFFKYIRLPFLWFIRLYQRILSPDHSFWAKKQWPQGFCKFQPTCSQYAYEAIEQKGLVRGASKACWRVLRCNPWSKGGVDEV